MIFCYVVLLTNIKLNKEEKVLGKLVLMSNVFSDLWSHYKNTLENRVNRLEIALITLIPPNPILCLHKGTEEVNRATWQCSPSLFTEQSGYA